MAMNKAEQAAMEALRVEAALRWPTEAEPQPMIREEIEAALVPTQNGRRVAKGWWFNTYSGTVERGWSSGSAHGWGNDDGRFGSQGMGRIYRTKSEAALALRWELCRQFAAKLRLADKMMEAE